MPADVRPLGPEYSVSLTYIEWVFVMSSVALNGDTDAHRALWTRINEQIPAEAGS